MKQSSGDKKVQDLLALADIEINGSRPWDIKVHNNKLSDRVLAGGSLALGESYMDGWWDVESLDTFFVKLLGAKLNEAVHDDWGLILSAIKARLFNSQKVSRAFQIGEKHYDVDDSVYGAMLDENRTYTCGYWKEGVNDLASAQNAKLDLICKKLGLKKGDRVLDIGCGWGSFAKYASTHYGASVVGVTVSKNQAEYARKACGDLPVEFRLQDYRSIDEKFDHIVSIGMFEHVGMKNYKTYMKVARRCLKDDGLFLLHTIGGNKSVRGGDPWISKYIFTNSMLPSIAQIGKSIENIFVMEDWHNFSADYDKTLMAWYSNFVNNWVKTGEKRDERFVRMWRYYLLACAASFRLRNNQLWQIVLSPNGVKGGHKTIR
jgi:cyclopropane-fatty-acyl-phospholipid synthase